MKKKLIIILAILIFIPTCALVGANTYVNSLIKKTNLQERKTDIIVNVDNSENAHELVNFLLLGTTDVGNVYKIASLDYTDSKVKLVSLDSQVQLYIPALDDLGTLNDAYNNAGENGVLETINYNLDLDVTRFATVSYDGIVSVVEKVGTYGFTNDDLKNLASDDVSSAIIQVMLEKFKAGAIKDVFKLINECLPYVGTNLTLEEIRGFAKDVLGFDLKNIDTSRFSRGRKEDLYDEGVIEIHKFLYSTDSYIPSENIPIN